MKEYTKEERYEIAALLNNVLLADLDIMDEEEQAIEAAMEIISPEFVADKEKDEQEAAEWFDSLTPEQIKETAEEFLAKLHPSEPRPIAGDKPEWASADVTLVDKNGNKETHTVHYPVKYGELDVEKGKVTYFKRPKEGADE